jgi:hypothetical protein
VMRDDQSSSMEENTWEMEFGRKLNSPAQPTG